MKSNRIEIICVVVLFTVSVGLVASLQLRSPYMIGVDSHDELFILNNVLDSGHWNPSFNHVYNGALGATVLPAIIVQVLGISAENVRYVACILFSVVPIVLFLLYKRMFNNNKLILAFLSSLIFIFNYEFFYMPSLIRQSFAFLTLAMAFFVLFNKNVGGVRKNLLLILFTFTTVVLHYSTGIIMVITLSMTYLLGRFYLMMKHRSNNTSDLSFQPVVSPFFLVVLLIFLTLYLSTVIVPFQLTINVVTDAVNALGSFLSYESHSYAALQQVGLISQSSFSYYINLILGYLIRFFIVIGVLISLLIMWRRKNTTVDNLTKNYHVLAFASLILMALPFIPQISSAYNLERVYLQALLVIALYFPIGLIFFHNQLCKIKINSIFRFKLLQGKKGSVKKILLFLTVLVLLGQLLSQMGVFRFINGNDGAPYFSDASTSRHFTLTQEITTVKLIADYAEGQRIFVDYYSKNVFKSVGGYSGLSYITDLINSPQTTGIFYVRFTNQKAFVALANESQSGAIVYIDINNYILDKDLIYTTKTVCLYYV